MSEDTQRRRPLTRETALLLVAALILVNGVTGYLLFEAYARESERTEYRAIYDYTLLGEYDYRAHLKENTLYNRTMIGPGEGKLYLPIVDHLDLSFRFTLLSASDTEATKLEISPTFVLSTRNGWRKSFTAAPFPTHGDNPQTTTLDPEELATIVSQIEQETGLRASSYNFTLTSQVSVEVRTGAVARNDYFEPKLVLTIYNDFTKGKMIEVSELSTTINRRDDAKIVVVDEQVLIDRSNYAVAASMAMVCLLASSYYYATRFIDRGKSPLRGLNEYKEIIVETSTPPSENQVQVNNVKDLASIANLLMKPIFMIKKDDSLVLYVKDEKNDYINIIKLNTENSDEE